MHSSIQCRWVSKAVIENLIKYENLDEVGSVYAHAAEKKQNLTLDYIYLAHDKTKYTHFYLKMCFLNNLVPQP